jgi:hypothetical protein
MVASTLAVMVAVAFMLPVQYILHFFVHLVDGSG